MNHTDYYQHLFYDYVNRQGTLSAALLQHMDARKRRLNAAFPFTLMQVRQLRAMQEKSLAAERLVLPLIRVFQEACSPLKKTGQLQGEEIRYALTVRHAALPDHPIRLHNIFSLPEGNVLRDDNYNSLPSQHPMGNDHHCRLFHQLYAVSVLAWTDLASLQDVQITLGLHGVIQPDGESVF
jgi:hypothetical protein